MPILFGESVRCGNLYGVLENAMYYLTWHRLAQLGFGHCRPHAYCWRHGEDDTLFTGESVLESQEESASRASNRTENTPTNGAITTIQAAGSSPSSSDTTATIGAKHADKEAPGA